MSREPKHGCHNALDPRPSTLDFAFAFLFGLFLGLSIWKFGNPVVLDQKIPSPAAAAEFLNDPWPTHWANWIFWPLAISGLLLAFIRGSRPWPSRWLWLWPLLWLAWQTISAVGTVDTGLTAATLGQFAGCVLCFFLGSFLFSDRRTQNILWIGVMIAFAFCLVRAIDQKFIEFPNSRQILSEGERTGWTNMPVETVEQMKRQSIIVHTNGVDIVNPAVMAKFNKGRVMGTLVYPNALAGLILLLWPLAIVLIYSARLRSPLRLVAMTTVALLGATAFYATGSKGGWLIAIAMAAVWLLRFRWPFKLKMAAIAAIAVVGLGIFTIRFHGYLANGATSASARFDYWRAAVQIAETHPVLGTGPGTFQRPYAEIKAPNTEMARLAHNDYLEQFSDSGFPGGIYYMAWIVTALVASGRWVWNRGELLSFAIFIGLLGWFLQGLVEFALYIPATAWAAFTLLGILTGQTANEFDNKSTGD